MRKRTAAGLTKPDDPPPQKQRTNIQSTPQLSCELCRERKVKCDKRDPCSNCVASGVVCLPIHRQRLPRGRHTNRVRWTAESSTTNATAAAASSRSSSTIDIASTSTSVDEGLRQRVGRLEALVAEQGERRILDGTQGQVSLIGISWFSSS